MEVIKITKNLSYFMREQKEEIVNAPAPESFVDENGTVLNLKLKQFPMTR